jgi:SAM-dependent methyltransferase
VLRDTDEDWKGIAGEPYYGVFSHLEYFRENLTPERLESFWASGRNDIDTQLGLLRQHYGTFEPRTAIDFGCGVGRLTRAMAAVVDLVHGIDVAPGMLEEARRGSPPNIRFSDSLPDEQVDWISSSIVFQHIHPAKGVPLFRQLLDRLAPGGGITVQLAFFKDRSALPMATDELQFFSWNGEATRALVATPYGSGTMMMYDYDMNQVLAMLYGAGIEDVSLRHSNHGGHHGALIVGRRTQEK